MMEPRKLGRLLDRVRGRKASGGAPLVEAHPEAVSPDAAPAAPHADPAAHGTAPDVAALHGPRDEVDTEEVDRLVRLTFTALLRRDPDRDTLLGYREGFANGSTFRDLIDDVVGSEEYRDAKRRDGQRRKAPEAPGARDGTGPGGGGRDEMRTAVARLTARLAEKGCQLRFSPLAEVDGGDVEDGPRVRRLLATLSVLDLL